MNFKDFKRFKNARYRVSVSLDGLQNHIERYINTHELDMNPEFQRFHVWTEQQQQDFVEYLLRDGVSGREIFFNCANWQGNGETGKMVLVDGKQRLEAVTKFLNDELRIHGLLCSEFEGMLPLDIDLYFNVNNLVSEADVVQWYIDMNSGGTDHTPEEIDKAQKILIDLRGGE